MTVKSACIIQLPKGESYIRGWRDLKQVIWSMAVVLIAAGILAGTVIYTVSVMRTAQMRILTGELSAITQTDLRE